jgi:hypothetical protein
MGQIWRTLDVCLSVQFNERQLDAKQCCFGESQIRGL